MFTNTKALTIPQGDVVKIECNGVIIWEQPSTYKNWVHYSINTDGTIYNNGLGYKNGYRVRSGGVEAESSTSVCTGYIPLKKGKTLYIYPKFTGRNNNNAINFFDSNFNNLGQSNDVGSYYGICNSTYKCTTVDGVSMLTLGDSHDASIAYVRVTHCTYDINDITNFIITVDEEITD